MAHLKTKIAKLESQLGLKGSVEDFLNLITSSIALDDREIQRIKSSRKYQEIISFIQRKNN